MAGNRKKIERRRIAAMAVAVILVLILVLGTISPFLTRADSLPSGGVALEVFID